MAVNAASSLDPRLRASVGVLPDTLRPMAQRRVRTRYTLAVTLQAALRRVSPSTYKAAVKLRHSELLHQIAHMPSRRRARQLFRAGCNVAVEIRGAMGLGGILSNAGEALASGKAHDVTIDLRLTSPTYAPSWDSKGDWLDEYFVRRQPVHVSRGTCEVRDIPGAGRTLSLRKKAEFVWDYMSIQSKFADEAKAYIPPQPYAAVHFRGSDKFLEAAPVGMTKVLEVVERQLQTSAIHKLFVASDEPRFVDLAQQRFGSIVFSVPLQAVATASGVPAHFTDLPGEIKAKEALVTMLILAQAAILVKTESLLSDWATTLAAQQQVHLVTPSSQ